MTVTVISSLYGDHDTVVDPPHSTRDVDWVLVTDRPHPTAGWRQIIEPRPHMHPRLAAKVAKCRPDLYSNSTFTIWVDASFTLADDLVDWCIDHLGDHDIAQLAHPDRVSIVEEAKVSAAMSKYRGQPVIAQAASYLKRGYPETWGLWATGLIVRRNTLPASFGDAWLSEQVRWTYQDQLSQPYLLWRDEIDIVDLPGHLWTHDMFSIRQHASAA